MNNPLQASGTLLSYSIQPGQVFVATSTTLTLTIRNPDAGPPVDFKGGPGGDEIDITIPHGAGADALASTLNFTGQSQTSGFTCARLAGSDAFAVRPVGSGVTRLLPGKTIVVEFTGVTINAVPSTAGQSAQVAIEEFIGDTDASTTVGVSKLPQQLAVVAWLVDYTVGLGQQTKLMWQSFGGTMVTVHGYDDDVIDKSCPDPKPGKRCFPVTGSPPYSGYTEVGVPKDQPARTYTVVVSTGDGKHEQQEVTLTQHKPVITALGAGSSYSPPAGPVGAMDPVGLRWATLYAARAFLQTPAQGTPTRVELNPVEDTTVVPGRDVTDGWQPGDVVPATADYVLTATGYGPQAVETVSYTLEPVSIAYFKYQQMKDGTLSGFTWMTDPPDWPAVEIQVSTAPYTFTVRQPGGGSVTAYLGPNTTQPQVQYFGAAAGEGGQYVLTWVTANVASLVLGPVGYDVPAGDVAKGSYTVEPDGPTTYVLTATPTGGGQPVTSTLVVDPS